MKKWHWLLIASVIGCYFWYSRQEDDEFAGEIIEEDFSPEGEEIEVDGAVY